MTPTNMTCTKCNGTGIKVVNNLADDTDKDFCDCEVGVEMMKVDALQIKNFSHDQYLLEQTDVYEPDTL